MNHLERAVAAMKGLPVDHIPFIARMDLWYSYHSNGKTLPERYRDMSLWDIQRDLGIGIFGFSAWDISFYRQEYKDILVEKYTDGGANVTKYETPYGTLVCRDSMAEELKEAAGTGARVEYPFKTEADYDALQFLFEHTEVSENYEVYNAFIESIGTDGLALPFTGHLPAHQLMLNYLGYQQFYLEMNDHPSRIEKLIEALTEQQRRILKLVRDVPVPAVEVGANYDEEMTPPPVFDAYFAPFYREAKQILDDRMMVVHGDGEMRKLLYSLAECGIDVVEALTPKPMTSIDIADTRRVWQDRVCMWGGLATVILTSAFSDLEFEEYLNRLFQDISPGNRFILGFGDNVPTDALLERIVAVAEFWKERGTYPISQ